MLSTSSSISGECRVTLGCVEVGEQLYAIDVAQLREVVRWQRATALPDAPALIQGVIDLRGAVVPVIDLGRALGLGAIRPGPRARIAVAEFEGLVMGLAVDAVVGVLSVEGAALEDPPSLATQAGYAAARAVVRRPGAEPLPLLALEHVLDRVYRSSPRAGEDGA